MDIDKNRSCRYFFKTNRYLTIHKKDLAKYSLNLHNVVQSPNSSNHGGNYARGTP